MKPCNKKSVVIGTLLLLALAGICIYVISKEFGFKDVMEAMKGAKVGWLLLGLVSMANFYVSEALNIGRGLKIVGYKIPLFKKLKYSLSGFFFSSVTPSASGGQPAQIFFMCKDGIKAGHGTFALLLELVGFEIASISIGFLGVIFCIANGESLIRGGGMGIILVAGFVVNSALLWGLLLLLFSKRTIKPITGVIIKVVHFFVRKKDMRPKVLRFVAEYRNASIVVRRDPKVLIKIVLQSLFQFVGYHSITYFVYRAMGLKELGWFPLMCKQGMLFTAASSIPLPGASGVTEGGFGFLFRTIFPANMLGSAIVLSRLISFVIPLIVSGLLLVVFVKVDNKKLVKKYKTKKCK